MRKRNPDILYFLKLQVKSSSCMIGPLIIWIIIKKLHINNSKYKGTWEGTYTGGDSGVIIYNVNDDGSIIGEIESDNFPNTDMTLKGKVAIDGTVNIRILYVNEIDWGGFTGDMTETNATGVWINISANAQGSWVASKVK